jgi:hypothetical protein
MHTYLAMNGSFRLECTSSWVRLPTLSTLCHTQDIKEYLTKLNSDDNPSTSTFISEEHKIQREIQTRSHNN